MLNSKKFALPSFRMKPKLGFLTLMCHVLYFQGRNCTWKCTSKNNQCPSSEGEMLQDGSGAYVYSGGSTSWEDWWTYDGISGPDFWGLLNLEWSLCSKGRRQSPVNIDPASLLYDPSLRPIHVDKIRVNGVITNTGHGVIFRTSAASHSEILNITGGPLSYKYRFSEIHIHFARSDEKGSEHLIAGAQFPAELQIYGYNSDLYQNITEAMSLQKNQGLVGISILLQTGDLSNPELRIITSQLQKIVHRGQEAPLKYLSLRDLMPDTPYYMTYEGSTTMPGCYETVTWIIMNKPIYITKQQLFALRRLMQGDEKNPKATLADNFRPTLDLNQRSIRTNIDFRRKPPTCMISRKALDVCPFPRNVASTEIKGHNVHLGVVEFCPIIILISIIINCDISNPIIDISSEPSSSPTMFVFLRAAAALHVVRKFLSTRCGMLRMYKSTSQKSLMHFKFNVKSSNWRVRVNFVLECSSRRNFLSQGIKKLNTNFAYR